MAVISGISFPFRTEGGGLPARARGVEVYRSAIVLLVKTIRRSRVMRPTVGVSLLDQVFENEGPLLESLIIRELTNSISTQIPDITILQITFQETGKRIIVNIFYSVMGVEDKTGPIDFGRAA